MGFLSLFKRREAPELSLDLPPEPPDLPEFKDLPELPPLEDAMKGQEPGLDFPQEPSQEMLLPDLPQENDLPDLPELGADESVSPSLIGPLSQEDVKERSDLGLPPIPEEIFQQADGDRQSEGLQEFSLEDSDSLELPDLPPLDVLSRQVKSKPVFLSLLSFRAMVHDLNNSRIDLRDIHQFVSEVGEMLHEEGQAVGHLKASLEETHRKLAGIDKILFQNQC
ncbi:hypothetical protein HYU14_03770 [Candidatus Woesearchaeota archaeon]|nr:hypothetical protein [Candidatus Woesearchaeota archaeon]